MLNTRIDILYRDGANFKSTGSAVIHGTFTKQQYERLIELIGLDGECVVHEVGLPNPAEQNAQSNDFPNPKWDHGFCNVQNLSGGYNEFYTKSLTSDKATVAHDASALIAAFEQADFDAHAEFNRLSAL